MKKTTAMLLVMALLCLLVSCGGGGGSFKPATSAQDSEADPVASLVLEPLPHAGVLNPLTGLPALEGATEGQRPVAVMVAGDARSLPRRGLAQADTVIEALDERGGTTLMAMYGDFRTVPPVGPVRYTQDQFIQFAVPSNAILAHIGGSSYAKNLLNVLAYQDVDGLYLGGTSFVYDTVRGTTPGGNKLNEDCWYTDANLIWAGAGAVGLNPLGEVRTLFQFAQKRLPKGSEAVDLSFSFNEAYPITLHYDAESNLYTKTEFGAVQTDEDGTPYMYNNVLVLQSAITKKADGFFLEYDLTGGSGWYFACGKVYDILWRKGGPTDPLRLIGPNGKELQVQQGKTYMALLPAEQGGTVSYVNQAQREQADAAAAQAAADAAAAQAAADAAAAQAAADAAAAQAAADAAAAASQPPPA